MQVFAQEDHLLWIDDFEEALKISEENDKPILMYFTGSDWCAPCKMLQEDFFGTEKFKEKTEELVLVKVDIPRRTDIISENQLKENKKLLAKYNKQKGFPQIIALNHKGEVLGTQGSYSSSLRDPSRYFSFVDMIIDNY
ncbi:hypothetical protein GCM10022393_19590 [Aquimarina addita]|uniref:Thioredoxin family protein n=2 Tax=Aquimarina addita TaxID=870485 RepID=A0ABP6UHP4_9FLAO